MNSKEKNPSEYCFIMFEIMIFVGPKMVGHAHYYPIFIIKDKARLNKVIEFKLTHNEECFQYAYLTSESRLGINVWAMNIENQIVCLGSAGSTIFDQEGWLKEGQQKMTIWPLKPFPKDIS